MKIKTLTLSVMLFLSPLILAKESKDDANQLLDELRKDLTSMSAEFRQYDVDASERISEVTTGKMWLNAPDQFKWEYLDPAPQLIVANGQKVWIYDEDLEQVTIKQQDSAQNPIYVLLNKELTETNYRVENWYSNGKEPSKESGEKSGINWISLIPRGASNEIKQVWLGILDNNLKILKLKNQFENIVVFEFSNIVKNPQLTDDFFTFIPPDGIDVIRDSVEL